MIPSEVARGGGGGGGTCIYCETGMCHYFEYFILRCSRIFGVPFWVIPGFLCIIFLKKI